MVEIQNVDYPVHSVELPFSKKKVEYRGWNMIEHKILIMAFQGEDEKDIQRAMIQILSKIVVSPINVTSLPCIEFDYLFLQARSKCVSEYVQISLTNKNTQQTKQLRINLNDVNITIPEDRNYKIPYLNPDGSESKYIFLMKEPSAQDRLDLLEMKFKNPDMDEEIELAIRCIHQICDQENSSPASEQEGKIRELITKMVPKQFEPFGKFLSETPHIRYEIDVKRVFPDMEGQFVLEGVRDFFE